MLKIGTVLLVLIFFPLHLFSQQDTNRSFSVFTGGMILKNSLLSTTKLGYELNHLGFIADFTYDDYRETWEDGSKSHFRIPAVSLSVRYYLQPIGRSFFAEANAGIGRPSLITRENGQKINRSTSLPISGFGLGWRFGRKPKGVFGEIGFRAILSLKDVHLYTTDDKPDTAGLDNISYQSWIFEKGKMDGQLYLGIGYSF